MTSHRPHPDEGDEMRNLRRALSAATFALAIGALVPAGAAAEERTCRGTIGAKTLDNVRVPQGAECVLKGTRVKGTVKVERNAVLRARKVNVIGNVQGESARRVNVVRGSRVGGSVQVVQGRAATVRGSRVNGNILYDDNNGFLRVVGNVVGADVQLFQNTGGARVARNTIEGNLQCKENRPRPTGDGNKVHGSKEDQCSRL
jgi:hypothetical protein